MKTTSDLPLIRIEPSRGWLSLDLLEVWEHRELLFLLVWRDVKVRYKQTSLGIAWAILQPLTTMLIFTGIFGKLARIPSEELRRLFGSFAVEVISAVSAADTSFSVRGQEIWRTLAAALLCLLVVESCFATWVGRQR